MVHPLERYNDDELINLTLPSQKDLAIIREKKT